MSADLINAVNGEIATLETDLRRDPRYRKLEQLKALRALYTGEQAQAPAPNHPRRTARQVNPIPRRRSGSPERQAILEKARAFLTGRNTLVPTMDIFEAISQEMVIPGKVPRNNLSAMLSNSDWFVSHGRSGWTLAENEETSDASTESNASEVSVFSASPAESPNVRSVNPWPGGGT